MLVIAAKSSDFAAFFCHNKGKKITYAVSDFNYLRNHGEKSG